MHSNTSNTSRLHQNHQRILPIPTALFTVLVIIVVLMLQTTQVMGKRRLCGKVLTQELRRVCTKQGTKGPCLHGHINVPAKRGFPPMQPLNQEIQSVDILRRTNLQRMMETVIHSRLHKQHSIPTKAHSFLYQRQRKSAIGFPSFLEQRRKRKGIVDQCCMADGCDDEFLDSFCCDEEEQAAFTAINTK